jgi:signal transduction histidine kinase
MSDYLAKDNLSQLPRVLERAIDLHQTLRAKVQADARLAESEKRLAEFAEHLQATIEQERAAIAREIHDDIGGSLAAVRHDLFWLERRLPEPEAQSRIKAAEAMLAHALEASQRIMMNLRPAILDHGLAPALEWLCQSFEKRTGVTVQCQASVNAPLSKAIELTAYRTVQEALTNISKHAQCSHVTVDLTDSEQCLTLEIADNGVGLTPKDRRKRKSFGLQGLEERAKSVKGWLDISSRPGAGTAIILSVPLNDIPPTTPHD